MVAATSTVPSGMCTTPTVSTVYNPSSPRCIVRSRPMLALPRNVSRPSWILLAIAHLRVLGEGAAGANDRAVTVMADGVQTVAAVRAHRPLSEPYKTGVLAIDQFADYLPRLLQLAGEAGNVFVRNRVH